MVIEVIVVILIIVIVAYIANLISDKESNKLLDISFKESLDLTDLPVVTFYNNNAKINFLLDTGANNSVINSNILDKYNYTKNSATGTVSGMEGNAISVSYVDMDIEYKNNKFNEEFQCVDMSSAFNKIKKDTGVTIHGILGNVFFRKYRYILDFEELKAYINEK